MSPSDRIIIGALCYLMTGDSVLMLRRNRPPHLDKWTAPGGKLELGESPDECIIREIKEETGLSLQHPVLRGIVTVNDLAYPFYWQLFVYQADQFSGDLIQSDEGALAWLPLAKLAAYDLPHADQQYLPYVLRSQALFRAKLVYDTPQRCLEARFYENEQS